MCTERPQTESLPNMRVIVFAAAVFFIIASVLSLTHPQSICADTLANTPSTTQPSHDTLHEAAWINDIQSVCLLLQQHGADVNQKSLK